MAPILGFEPATRRRRTAGIHAGGEVVGADPGLYSTCQMMTISLWATAIAFLLAADCESHRTCDLAAVVPRR